MSTTDLADDATLTAAETDGGADVAGATGEPGAAALAAAATDARTAVDRPQPADNDAAEANAEASRLAIDESAVRTFRGRTLEELLPQIRDELGPDAIVIRQREGLRGGVGGFFQQRFVEVDAVPGPLRPRIDVYDEAPATPESFAALLAEAEDADPIVTAVAFAPPLAPQALPRPSAEEAPSSSDAEAASAPDRPDVPAASAPAAAPELEAAEVDAPADEDGLAPALADHGPQRDAIADELIAGGLSATFAERLVADAEAHELPFAGDLRAAVRSALARRLPAPLPQRAGGLAVAFAGPGSTACADALAAAYVRAGRRAHAHATIEQARARIERGAPDAVVALDLPPIAAGDAAAAVSDLAQRLAVIELDEILIVVPAGADAVELRTLHDRLAALRPTGLALDGADKPAAALGAVLELSCTTRLPLRYVLDRTGPAGARIAPADATALARRLLP